MTYNMNALEKSITELHGMLKDAEQNFKKTTPFPMVHKGKGGVGKGKPKDKLRPKSKGKAPKPKPQKEVPLQQAGALEEELPTLPGRAEEGKCDSLYFRYLCYRSQPFYFNILGIRYWMWFSHLFKCAGAAK